MQAELRYHITNSGDIGELYLVMIARPEPVKITAGSGKKRFPSW